MFHRSYMIVSRGVSFNVMVAEIVNRGEVSSAFRADKTLFLLLEQSGLRATLTFCTGQYVILNFMRFLIFILLTRRIL